MQNVNIRFTAKANFGQAKAELAALEKDVRAFQTAAAAQGYTGGKGINPQGYQNLARSIDVASSAYRNAVNSTGAFEVSQIKTVSGVEKMTEALRKGEVGMSMWSKKGRAAMAEVRKEQLRLRQASAVNWGTDASGKQVTDVSIPKQYSKAWETANSRVGQQIALLDSFGKKMAKVGKDTQYFARRAMMSFALPAAVAGAAAGQQAYQADMQLTRVAKVYDTTPGADQIQRDAEITKLRADSFDLAAASARKYGAALKDTLEIEGNLAAAGARGKELMEQTDAVMRIATLGELDTDKATDLTLILRNGFKLASPEIKKTFDYMNAVDNATNASIADIAEGLPRAGAALKSVGVDAKNATALIAAFRDQGFDAATGANFLKSMANRTNNPTTDAIAFYKKFDIDLIKIRDQTGGNLQQYFEVLAKQQKKIKGANDKLTRTLRFQGLSKLAGSYQSSRATGLLAEVTDAEDGRRNNYSIAKDLMNKDAQNAATSQLEISRKMDSASGKFQATLRSLQVEFAKFGQPFLEVGTKILGLIDSLLSKFNDLPKGAKKYLAIGTVLAVGSTAALAVLATMIEFAGKGMGLLKLVGSVIPGVKDHVNLMTKAEVAQQIETKKLTTAFEQQTAAILTQADAYKLLRQSMGYARQKQMQEMYPHTRVVPDSQLETTMIGALPKEDPRAKEKGISYYSSRQNRPGTGVRVSQETPAMSAIMPPNVIAVRNKNGTYTFYNPRERGVPIPPTRTPPPTAVEIPNGDGTYSLYTRGRPVNTPAGMNSFGNSTKPQQVSTPGTMGLSSQANAAAQLSNAKKTSEEVATSAENTRKSWFGTKTAAAGYTAMLGASLLPASKLTNYIFTAATVLTMASASKDLFKLKEGGKSAMLLGRATGFINTKMGSAGKLASGFGSKVGMIGKAVGSVAFGPWGVAIAAAGFGLYKLKKHLDHIKDVQESTLDTAKAWGDALNVAGGKWADMGDARRYAGPDVANVKTGGSDLLDFKRSAYESRIKGNKQLSNAVDKYSQLEAGSYQRQMIAMQQYISLIKIVGLDSKTAGRAMSVFFEMAGLSVKDANDNVEKLRKSLGKTKEEINATDYSSVIKKAVQAMSEMGEGQASPMGITAFQNTSKFKQVGQEAAKVFSQGFNEAQANNRFGGSKFIQSQMADFSKAYQSAYSKMTNDQQKALNDYGVTSARSYETLVRKYQAYVNNSMSGKDRIEFSSTYLKGDPTGIQLQNALGLNSKITSQIQSQSALEYSMTQALAKQAGIKGNVGNLQQLLNALIKSGQAQTLKSLDKEWRMRIGIYNIAKQTNAMGGQAAAGFAAGAIPSLEKGSKAYKAQLASLNSQRIDLGLSGTTNLMDGFNDKITEGSYEWAKMKVQADRTKASINGGKGAAGGLTGQIHNAADAAAELASQADKGAAAYGAIANSLADKISAGLESRQQAQSDALDARIEAHNKSLERKSQAIEDRASRRSEAINARADRRSDAIDKAFDRRTKAVEKYYKRRIDGVNNQIKAEENADKIRQRLFEAETNRLERLADAQNKTIDFNVAVNSGNLGEAAKIINDKAASTGKNAMDDDEATASAQSEKRTEALQKRIDALEAQKDNKTESLQAQKERAQKSLEIWKNRALKGVEAERNAAAKSVQIEKDKYAKQAEAQKKSLQARQQREKANLDFELQLLRSGTFTSKKQLMERIRIMQKQYGDFGVNLKSMGLNVSKYIKDQMIRQATLAAIESGNIKEFREAGKKIAANEVQGIAAQLGVKPKELSNWLNEKTTRDAWASLQKSVKSMFSSLPKGLNIFSSHSGSVVGGSSGRRTGMTGGMKSQERLMNVQVGETITNKASSTRYAEELKAINNGTFGTGGSSLPPGAVRNSARYGHDGGTKSGFGIGGASPITSAVAKAATQATSKVAIDSTLRQFASSWLRAQAVAAAKAAAAQRAASMSGSGPGGSVSGGRPGNYGGRNYSAEQMGYAAIIANVGAKRGMSVRDQEIAIMTAITESGLRNLRYGDRDSQGLFQQRPSQGWGTVAQVTTPKYAAGKFYSALAGVKDRGKMSPWMAAQRVQRSAFSDGRNYLPYWDDAIGIYKAFKKAKASGAGYSGGGDGKAHRPVPRRYGLTQGIHDGWTGFPAVDFGVPIGTPVYAVGNGTITKAKNLSTSYGHYYQINHGGFSAIYAHLSSLAGGVGRRVKGGDVIGRSGSTGNSTGPHLHFGVNRGGPMRFVGLQKGGEILHDNTLVNAHRGETVLSRPMTELLKNNIANYNGKEYSISIDMRGATVSKDVDIQSAVETAIDKMETRKGRSRVVRD